MVLETEKGETKPMRILLTIAYDGTRYSGWQKQKSPEVLTVEGEVEKALRTLFRNPELECIGASRTDRGVHALGQRAVIDVETTIPPEKIPLAIRPFLPEDIVVTAAREVPGGFPSSVRLYQKNLRISYLSESIQKPQGAALQHICI